MWFLTKIYKKEKEESAADCHKRIMDNTDGCRYIYMTVSVDEARQSVRVHKYHVKQTNKCWRTQAEERNNEERKDTVEVVDVEPTSEMGNMS